MHDPIRHPAHYEIYPVQPIEIARHLGFCLGNAVKYVLRAPYKGGVEDCDKARQYLSWERESGGRPLTIYDYYRVEEACSKLEKFLDNAPGDKLWDDIAGIQSSFVEFLALYCFDGDRSYLENMFEEVMELSRVLALRDTTGQIYEGMTGLPQKPVEEGE